MSEEKEPKQAVMPGFPPPKTKSIIRYYPARRREKSEEVSVTEEAEKAYWEMKKKEKKEKRKQIILEKIKEELGQEPPQYFFPQETVIWPSHQPRIILKEDLEATIAGLDNNGRPKRGPGGLTLWLSLGEARGIRLNPEHTEIEVGIGKTFEAYTNNAQKKEFFENKTS